MIPSGIFAPVMNATVLVLPRSNSGAPYSTIPSMKNSRLDKKEKKRAVFSQVFC